MRYRFYYEHAPAEDVWDVMEEDGGQEHGQFYDTLLFSTPTEEDAVAAVETLMKLVTK